MLWLACITPTGRLGVTAAAGLFPISAVLLAGTGSGASLLGGGLCAGSADPAVKGVALMYLCFMGLYPVVKSRLEQCASRPLEWVGKLACFNGALTLLWVVFRGLFLPALPEWLAGAVWLLYGAGNLVFLLYDWGLSRLIGMMTARLKLR